MSTRRLGVGVAVLGGFLYAVGGSDGTSPLNTGKLIWYFLICNTVKPVLETSCIKQYPALRDHCSDTTFLLKSA